MRYIIWIGLIVLTVISLFQFYIVFSNSHYLTKSQTFYEKAPIKVIYREGKLWIYNPNHYLIKNVTIESDTSYPYTRESPVVIPVDQCPRAIRIDTEKGVFKVFYIQCKS